MAGGIIIKKQYSIFFARLVASALFFTATGNSAAAIESYDITIPALMIRWNIPGVSVAVMKDNQLVFANGYGVADMATGSPVALDSLFRIASISKPITATCIMRLVEQGRLSLDTPAFPLLNLGTPVDVRVNQISIQNLLEHSGGWDREVSGDPMMDSVLIARTMGVSSPPDPTTTVRYMLTKPLDFSPGSKTVYSNFGYSVLGRVIEKVTGQTYENYANEMLAEIGITDMKIGHGLITERFPKEVKYYSDAYEYPYPSEPMATSVYDRAPGTVALPDGAQAIESLDSVGGWLATAIDLVTFASSFNASSPRRLVSPATFSQMLAKPSFTAASDTVWYGKGWLVNNYGNWHTGALYGSASYLVNESSGYQWAILANTENLPYWDSFITDIDSVMWASLRSTGVNLVTASQSNCIFRGAERLYPQLFSPARPSSDTLSTDYYSIYDYHYYEGTKNYIATSVVDQHIWVLGPSFGSNPVDMGPVADYLTMAGCQ